MFRIQWINRFLVFGYLLGEYRNYSHQKRSRRILIFLQIFLQTILNFITVLYELYILLRGEIIQMNVIYSIFVVTSFATATMSVVSSISRSDSFISYAESINRIYQRFGNDTTVSTSLKRLSFVTVFLTLFSIVFAMLRSGTVIIKFLEMNADIKPIEYTTVFFSQSLVRLTIFYRNILTFIVIMFVVIMSKSFNSLIKSVQDKLGEVNAKNEDQSYELIITKEVIQEWLDLYLDLANCCEKVMECFGRQVCLFIELRVFLKHASEFHFQPFVFNHLVRIQSVYGLKFWHVIMQLFNVFVSVLICIGHDNNLLHIAVISNMLFKYAECKYTI